MNIKSYTNGDIYNNIYNYYTILESRIYINNDKEIEECKTLYKKVISTKDKIINDKKNNIEKEKVNIQRQVDTLMKQLDIKNNSGEIIKKDINNNINKINQLLNEVTINDLKDISSSIINIENNIRNTIGNNEKQKLLIELINKEDMLVSKSKKADENYDVMIELNDNSREKLNIYDSLINELLSERAIITRNLANIFNLLDINTEMQKISEIILKLGNTKFDLQNKITLTAQIISNYNDELSKY
jgi:glutamine synthetase adenylyltransferase